MKHQLVLKLPVTLFCIFNFLLVYTNVYLFALNENYAYNQRKFKQIHQTESEDGVTIIIAN